MSALLVPVLMSALLTLVWLLVVSVLLQVLL
jgi:hypothetical protein